MAGVPVPDGMVVITREEYSELRTIQQSADYVYGIIHHVAYDPEGEDVVREFALNLLDEWTK
jgi:hypothetical protein